MALLGYSIPAVLLLSLLGLICHEPSFASAAKVDSRLLKSIAEKKTATIIIEMSSTGTKSVLNRVERDMRKLETRGQKSGFLYRTLRSHADREQKSLLSFLEANNAKRRVLGKKQVEIISFWISNEVAVKNADEQLIQELSERGDIYKIREEVVVPLMQPIDFKLVSNSEISPSNSRGKHDPWGIKHINCTTCWKGTLTGEGVTVAIIDTGTNKEHEALQGKCVGSYNGFDGSDICTDTLGHGTHVAGTVCGSEASGVGVAHGAKYMDMKACETDGCPETALKSCGQKVTCLDTSHPLCGPIHADICTNSWGGQDGYGDWMGDVIEAWKRLGIIIFFACGNSGYGCGTVSYPASHPDVIAIAAYDEPGYIAYFSSRGPAIDCKVHKPDFSCPGVGVLSAWHTSTTAYAYLSGTSMATPHAAGLAALLLSQSPNITATALRELYEGRAVHHPPDQDIIIQCLDKDRNSYPNFYSGHGKIGCHLD